LLRFTATCKNWTQSRAPLHEQYRHHQTQMSVKHIWRHMSLQSNFTMVIYLKKSKEDMYHTQTKKARKLYGPKYIVAILPWYKHAYGSRHTIIPKMLELVA